MEKEYRVDIFKNGEHQTHYFESEKAARHFASSKKGEIGVMFLLKHLLDGKYDVMEELKN